MIEEVGKIGKKKKQEASALANLNPSRLIQKQPDMNMKKEEISKINETDKVSFSSEVMRGEA